MRETLLVWLSRRASATLRFAPLSALARGNCNGALRQEPRNTGNVAALEDPKARSAPEVLTMRPQSRARMRLEAVFCRR